MGGEDKTEGLAVMCCVRELEDKMQGAISATMQSRPGDGVRADDSRFTCSESCHVSLAFLQHGDFRILYFTCFRPIFFGCC